MDVLIVEDEAPTARRLARLLVETDANTRVLATLESISETVQWFAREAHLPHLAFMDIRLADGLSFEVFKQVNIPCPVVFTTSYHEYMQQAFKVNSIDYLLKPISQEALAQTLRKYRDLKHLFAPDYAALEKIVRAAGQASSAYRVRFLVYYRDTFLSVATDEVAYLYSEQKITRIITHANRVYPVELTLEQAEEQLNPAHFFRVSRQFIVSFGAIGKIHDHFNGRLRLVLTPPTADIITLSREKSSAFKRWLDR